MFRYIHFNIDTQNLRSPIFTGRYFINLGQNFGRNPLTMHISQAGHVGYGSTALTPQFRWDDGFQGLIMQDIKAEMSFVSLSSSHYMFPFDAARFNERFSFDPPIDIKAAYVANNVAGFYIPCDTVAVHTSEGNAEISFELRRNPLIVDTAVLLLVVVAMFAVFITLFMETGPLPHALSSYFFAVWTIRALFGLTAEGFPTLFDLCIVSLVLLIVLLLFLRGLGLRQALIPVGRRSRNLVRRLEGRELLSGTTGP